MPDREPQHRYLDRPRTPVATKLIVLIAIALLLVAGVIFLGRIASDDRMAMAYTGGWFALVGGGALLLARRRRDLWLPIGAAVATVGAAVTILLALPMFTDDEVNERVVTGTPASRAAARGGERDRADGRAAGNVQVAAGAFEGLEHSASGNAAVVRMPNGERRLTLTNFETDNGPDLFVYLVEGDVQDEGDVDEFEDLGKLKGNKGNQQYEIPREVDVSRYSTVVIWCRVFTVAFARASLESS